MPKTEDESLSGVDLNAVREQIQVNRAVCKFRCDTAEPAANNPDRQTVKLWTEYDPNLPEDQKFSKYTPSGDMNFVVENGNLNGFFVVGKSYLITITPAD